MNKKHSISSLLVMLYVLYIIYFMQTISIEDKRRRNYSVKILGFPTNFTYSRIYYQIVLTDYNKRREIEIIYEENCGIKEMDTMEVVHGIFSKKVITINTMPTEIVTTQRIIFNFIISLIPLIIIIGTCYNIYVEYENYKNSYTYNEDYNYEEDDSYLKKQREENTREILPNDEKYYEKIITINDYKSSENVDIKIEKLFLGKRNSKLQFRMKNKTDVALVLNIPYETHVFDKSNNKNSNILLPGEEYYFEMDIFESYKKFKYLDINLEYTLSPYVMQEYMDSFYYYYYPLNMVDCSSKIHIDLLDGKCEIEINEYGNFYNKSDKIIEFKGE